MPRIAIDMDEVIADSLSEYLSRYNADFGQNLKKEDLLGQRLADLVSPEHWPRLNSYFDDASFFANLDVMEDSQNVIRELAAHYDIFIVTAAMEVPCSFVPKFEWLQRHFPFISPDNYVFCGNKGIIAADYLIDDSIYQLQRFEGQGIIYTSPRNIHEKRFPRVNNWQEVREMFVKQDESEMRDWLEVTSATPARSEKTH
jgi:5'(3')-deoxyribonucleotidase